MPVPAFLFLLKFGGQPDNAIDPHDGIVSPALPVIVEQVVDLNKAADVVGKLKVGAGIDVKQGV